MPEDFKLAAGRDHALDCFIEKRGGKAVLSDCHFRKRASWPPRTPTLQKGQTQFTASLPNKAPGHNAPGPKPASPLYERQTFCLRSTSPKQNKNPALDQPQCKTDTHETRPSTTSHLPTRRRSALQSTWPTANAIASFRHHTIETQIQKDGANLDKNGARHISPCRAPCRTELACQTEIGLLNPTNAHA
jgi:hypothetical protein